MVAAAGSVALVCLTARAVAEGTKTPLEVADVFYGTHFGDSWGWLQGYYASKGPSHPTISEIDLYVRYGPQGVLSIGTGASMPKAELDSLPHPPPHTLPAAKERQRASKEAGRIYVTYTKYNTKTSRHYSGRTSMVIDLAQPLRQQAYLAVTLRDMNHHVDESDEPRDAAFKPADVDMFDVGAAVDYNKRYEDPAYWRVRGREQQLIDSYGGAQSDTGKPYRTENIVRAVAKGNPLGKKFHGAATTRWGQLHHYTGH